jgi:hypothetical protein
MKALVLLCVIAGAASAATIETVALQNAPSPEAPFVYKKFDRPAVSDAAGERVAVFARLAGKKCLFALDSAGSGTTVVCVHDLTPDALHVFTKIATNLGDASINAASAVAWAARYSAGRAGVFRSGPAVVADIGDPVPVPGTGLLQAFSYARITDADDVLFVATISGGGAVAQGIFRCSGGNGNCSAASGGTGTLTALALVNDPVPDRPGRAFCKFLELDASTYGATFRAATQLDCSDGGETPAVGVFRRPVAGPTATVALEGEACTPTPIPGGTTYLRLPSAPGISNGGMVAFQGTTGGLLVNNVVYLCDPATCPASPATDGVAQGDFDGNGNMFRTFSPPDVSDAGDVAFSAKVSGPAGTRDALYIRRFDDSLETIVLADVTPVPSSSPAAIFDQAFAPRMSSAGKVTFGGRIERNASPSKLRGVFLFE